MITRPRLKIIRHATAGIAAALIGIFTASAAHADGPIPTSTVGAPPMPAPVSWVGDPPSLIQPAVLPYIETTATSELMMNIHGLAFEDLNANGRRDAGEPAFHGAWLKVSGGGSWFVCSPVERNGAFGLPVIAGVYHIQPVNVKGFRVTTPQIDVPAMGRQMRPALIGYARDASAVDEGCDTYNPGRPLK
jgi:hypothetical protein